MEFIPRKPAAAAQVGTTLDARQRSIRDAGVGAVAAALGLVEVAATHAKSDISISLPKAA